MEVKPVQHSSSASDNVVTFKANNNASDTLSMSQSKEQILSKQDTEDGVCVSDEMPATQVAHPTSYMDTMLHIFRGNIGSGLLAMGDAFKHGGLIFATVMTVVLGIICVHAQHLLLSCSEEMHVHLKRDKAPGFAETVHLVFKYGPQRLRFLAPAMKILVNTFLCITQLGFCCVYIVFIANNVKLGTSLSLQSSINMLGMTIRCDLNQKDYIEAVIKTASRKLGILNRVRRFFTPDQLCLLYKTQICDHYDIEVDLSVHMIFVVIPVLLSCMVRNLKYLTPFSTIANVLMAVGVSVVCYEASRDLPAVSTRDYIGSWQQLPLYFGTAIYAFEGIGLVLPLKNEMRHPELFQKPLGVLNVSMTVVGSIFIVIGFLGYLKWGDNVQGSLTLNLNPGLVLSNVVQSLIALAIMFTYPLQFYVPVDITWPVLKKKCGEKMLIAKELGFRAMLVLLTFVLAESIPQLGLFISLVGAVSSTALALVFPPIIELVSFCLKPKRASAFTIVKDSAIILLGLFIFVTGTYESVASIIKAFKG